MSWLPMQGASLLRRSVATNVALVGLTGGALLAVFVLSQRSLVTGQTRLRAQTLAAVVAAASAFPIRAGNRQELQRIATAALAVEDVQSVEIAAADRTPPVRAAQLGSGLTGDPDLLEVTAPVPAPADASAIGAVRIVVSPREQQRQIAAMIRTATWILAAGIAIVCVIEICQLRRLLAPIEDLIRFTSEVGRGDLSRRAIVRRTDEIGQLADAFNRMVAKLGATTVSRDYIGNILRSMSDSVVVIDAEGNVEAINQAARTLLGYSEEELAGTSAALLLDGPRPPASASSVECTYRAKSGRLIPVLLSAAVLRNGHNEPLGEVWAAQNISEQKRIAEELRSAKESAEQASRAKSNFIANMSHELRTPLNAIIGYSELLQEECADNGCPTMIDDLARIRTSGYNLLAMVNDLLDMSRIEAGRMPVHLEWFQLKDVLRTVLTDIEPLAQQGGNRLSVRIPDAILLHNDPEKLRQSLVNLLSNACKFTQNGDVSLVIERESIAGRDWLRMRVGDTGIGIAREELPKLFQPFSQVDASTTRRYGGTGLGLALTHNLCRVMGGQVAVESAPGVGSTFTMLIPMAVAAPPNGQQPQQEEV